MSELRLESTSTATQDCPVFKMSELIVEKWLTCGVAGDRPALGQDGFVLLLPNTAGLVVVQNGNRHWGRRPARNLSHVDRNRHQRRGTGLQVVASSAVADFDAAGTEALHRDGLGREVQRRIVAGHLVARGQGHGRERNLHVAQRSSCAALFNQRVGRDLDGNADAAPRQLAIVIELQGHRLRDVLRESRIDDIEQSEQAPRTFQIALGQISESARITSAVLQIQDAGVEVWSPIDPAGQWPGAIGCLLNERDRLRGVNTGDLGSTQGPATPDDAAGVDE